MARKQEARTVSARVLLECQVHLVPRGRSVINGTMLVDGYPKTFKQELDSSARNRFEELVLREIILVDHSLG